MEEKIDMITMDKDADYFIQGNRLMMRLVRNNRDRCIGIVDGNAKLYTKFENDKGLHIKTNSFSLPYSLLKWLKEKGILGVKIIYQGIHYKSLVEDWLNKEKGEFLYFKSKAEKKIYLNRTLMK